jgi:hypothetical protein
VQEPQDEEEEKDADAGDAEEQHREKMLCRCEQAHGHGDQEVDHENENQGGYPLVHQLFGFEVRAKYRKKSLKSNFLGRVTNVNGQKSITA